MTYAEAMKRAIRELEWSAESTDRIGRAQAAEAWVTVAREIREALSSGMSIQELNMLQHIAYPPVDM